MEPQKENWTKPRELCPTRRNNPGTTNTNHKLEQREGDGGLYEGQGVEKSEGDVAG